MGKFNFLSLDYVYYPVSGILWFWHKIFGFVLGNDSGIAWALAVVLLVCTLRAILYRPFVKQIQTTRQMQEFQPQMKALQKKYGKDRQKLAVEMQKLQKEHGFNPLLGCLPALLQVPVFIGLYHVLRSFNRMSGGATSFMGGQDMTAEQTRNTANYFFSPTDVQSFLDARLFGVPLSSSVQQPQSQWVAFMNPDTWSPGDAFDFTKLSILLLAIPLMIVAGLATHFNARASVARQPVASLDNPQTAIMNKLMLWVFPLGVLVGGFFLPVAILLYWVTQNIWTYFQQRLVFGRMEREADEKREAAKEKAASNAPKPGAKPKVGNKPKPGSKPSLTKSEPAAGAAESSDDEPEDAKSGDNESGDTGSGGQSKKTTLEKGSPEKKGSPKTPKPGTKPVKRPHPQQGRTRPASSQKKNTRRSK